MKALFPFIFTLLTLSSCMESQSQDVKRASKSDLNSLNQASQKHFFVDGKTGLVVSYRDYPSYWNIVSRPIYNLDADFPTFLYLIENKKGMKAFNTPIHQFVSFQNPILAQEMRRYGLKNERPLMSPTSFIENEIKPLMERDGFKFLAYREFPEITKRIAQQREKYGLNQIEMVITPTEWVNKDNIKGLVVLNQMISHLDPTVTGGEVMKVWNYQLNFFFAPSTSYEADLATALHADFTAVQNPLWEKYQMQVNNYRQQQKNIEHRRFISEGQNTMDASHRRFIDNLNGSNTSSYSSNDSHSKFIDMIREEQNVSLDGKTFKVNAGADNYWMNSDGKYISSNDAFYNPNQDPVYDNQPWNLTTKD